MVYSYPSLIPLSLGLSPVRYKTRFPLYLKGKDIKMLPTIETTEVNKSWV